MTATEMMTASMRAIDFDDTQLLRYWRNLDHVRQRMVMKNHIERDGQRKWFAHLNNETVKYFIFSLGMKDIGCANLTKINIEEKTFEGGVFCGDAHYLNHWINIWACMKIYDQAFFELKLDTSYATILTDNKAALSLNKSLGYTFVKYADENIGRFILTRTQYMTHSEKIRRYLNNFARQLI
tara:strand:- start:581 stop:1126 length:546 start_codon:yes stop_codon:yes gene_type:complete